MREGNGPHGKVQDRTRSKLCQGQSGRVTKSLDSHGRHAYIDSMTAMLLYRTLNIRIRPEVMDKLADIQKALGGVAMVQAVESSILAYDIGVTLDGTKKAYGKTAFRAPTLAEVKEHCGENGYKFDPEAFWSFYESKG